MMNFIRNRSRTKLFTILKETKAISRFLFCGCKSYCGYFHERKRRNSEGRRRMERGKKKTHERARKRVNEHARRKRTLQDKSWSRVSQAFFTIRRCFIRNIFNYFERFRRASERNEWNTRCNSSSEFVATLVR